MPRPSCAACFIATAAREKKLRGTANEAPSHFLLWQWLSGRLVSIVQTTMEYATLLPCVCVCDSATLALSLRAQEENMWLHMPGCVWYCPPLYDGTIYVLILVRQFSHQIILRSRVSSSIRVSDGIKDG